MGRISAGRLPGSGRKTEDTTMPTSSSVITEAQRRTQSTAEGLDGPGVRNSDPIKPRLFGRQNEGRWSGCGDGPYLPETGFLKPLPVFAHREHVALRGVKQHVEAEQKRKYRPRPRIVRHHLGDQEHPVFFQGCVRLFDQSLAPLRAL